MRWELALPFWPSKQRKKIKTRGRRAKPSHTSESPVKRTIWKWSLLEKATLMLKLVPIWTESRQCQAAEVSDPHRGAQDFNLWPAQRLFSSPEPARSQFKSVHRAWLALSKVFTLLILAMALTGWLQTTSCASSASKQEKSCALVPSPRHCRDSADTAQ